MNRYSFTLALVLLLLLAGLVYLTIQGSVLTTVILAILVTILLIGIGAAIALAAQKMANEKSQADFVNNAKENVAIMAALQRVQNAQNQAMMQQLGKMARLSEPQNGPELDNILLIDDGIFEELED